MGTTIHGAVVKRSEDPRLITGKGSYLGNVTIEDELWMTLVRSDVPHADVASIDATSAIQLPGVVAIYTASDFAGVQMPIDAPDLTDATRRPLITDRVRFVGEVVAAVVAESAEQSADAAAEIWVEYYALPAVTSVEDALSSEAPILFPELGTNIVYDRPDPVGQDLHDGAARVTEVRVLHQRIAAVPLETNNALAVPRADGGTDLWVGSQQAHGHRDDIAAALGVDRELLHVKVPDMGGGFGAKIYCYPEQVLTVALSRRLQRPVRYQESRSENLLAMSHGRARVHTVELGVTDDGKITSLRVSAIQDAGAYPLFGAYLPAFTKRMASGPYDIPRIEFHWKSAVTNTTPVHAYRGAGRPEATLDLERVIDLAAHELGIDPIEMRRRNYIPRESFPHRTAVGELYDSGDHEAALDLALERVDLAALRAEQARRRDQEDRWQLGIGVASYTEITAPGGRKDWGKVEVDSAGGATIYSGASSHGHSHETTFAQIISQTLRIPLSGITFVQADTDRIALGGGTMGSRSMQMAGTALLRAGEAVVTKAREIVAHVSEAAIDDVKQFEDGRIGVVGVPDSGLTLGEISTIAQRPDSIPPEMTPGLDAEDTWVQDLPSFTFGTHISVAEVDTETGDVRLRTHVACDDCGTILNRMVVDGQVHGGIAQGIGQALYEQIAYDVDANPLTTNLTSYLLPTAVTLPDIEIGHTETPTNQNALGAKGIGEAGTIGSTPAVVNAVHDAIRHLGVVHIDMPLTPARIWTAIHS